MRAELKKKTKNTYINTDYFQKILHGQRISIIIYLKIVEINEVKTTIQSVATGNQPASTSEPQKELAEAPVYRSVSTVNASLSRNLLSDMNLLQYANISGGTFIFNIVNQEYLFYLLTFRSLSPCLSPFISDPTGCVQLVISLLII